MTRMASNAMDLSVIGIVTPSWVRRDPLGLVAEHDGRGCGSAVAPPGHSVPCLAVSGGD